MKIEIWSDIACPYCYIGKRKLEMALDQFENKDDVELVWRSYQLDPFLPKRALKISIYEHFAQSYALSIDEAKRKQQEVIDIAKTVGLAYDYDKLVVANTGDALRLVKLAAEYNLATEAEEVIFDSYFIKGRDISDRATLVELGEKIGLNEDEIDRVLDSEKYYDKMVEDMEYSEGELSLEYIPFYRLNNNQIIQGSIDVDDYLKAIRTAYADWQSGLTSDSEIITGQSCSIDGVCS